MEREHPASLADLLARFLANGDEKAMEELVRRTQPRLLATARRIASATDAEDAVQTAYHSLLRKGKIPSDAPLMAWLLTAVVRIAYRHRATAKREHEIARRLAQETHVPSGETGELARLRREVDRLPSSYRDAVVLHYLEGLSAAEAGKLLGVSEAAVWQRLHRARALLRSRLPSHFKYGLMVLPWRLADTAGAAMLVGGDVMKGKAVLVGTFVLVLSLCGGAVWTVSEGERETATRTARQEGGVFAAAGEPDASPSQAAETATQAASAPHPAASSAEQTPGLSSSAAPPAPIRGAEFGNLLLLVDDGAGKPIRGTKARVSKPFQRGEPIEWHVSVTDHDGRVEFAGLPPGRKMVIVHRESLQRTYSAEIVKGRVCTLRAVFLAGTRVEGQVRHVDGRQLEGMELSVYRKFGKTWEGLTTTLGAGGFYSLSGVLPGKYRVYVKGLAFHGFNYLDVRAQGYKTRRQRVELRPGENRVHFELEPKAKAPRTVLVGAVRGSATSLPISGAVLRWHSVVAVTDDRGAYRFFDTHTDRIDLAIERDGYGVRVLRDVAVDPDKPRTLDIRLDPAAIVRLRFTNTEGNPVWGRIRLAALSLDPDGPRWSTALQSDEDGRVTYSRFAPGEYQLFFWDGPVMKIDLQPGTTELEVRLGP